ncbi:t-SNARE [Microdochium trichocladiopsis]|uniref:t-SNARE n=1 Tax=Microdochium trichocladiopsis TaxID=1682393 RepID=A0A9P8Y225_9PEZI|nr:t-SNARE [Microdochium trichocladiopsis]KAH7027765.1 t-SNARE [Microdochium trichocladiopsis]
MASLTQNQGGFAGNIFDEISQVNRGIDTIDQNLNQLKMLQQRSLDEADSSGSSNTSRQLNDLSADTMAQYRTLTDQVRQIKSNREAQQPKYRAQVGNVDRRLKQAIQAYQQVESQYRKRTQDQMARQYRIVRPDASEDEVRAAVEDQTGGQVFQQALMQSNRRGQAQAVLSAVQDRHAQLQKIEQQLMELAQLFQDLDTLVIQQDVAVMNIEQKAEETVENLDKGNEEVGTAIKSARGARKKKWICFGIVVTIIVIIAIAVAIYVVTNQKKSAPAKRWLVDDVVFARAAESGLVASRSFAKSVLEEHKRSIENLDIGAIAKRIPRAFGDK